jgi:hypothetical protein
VSSAAAIQGRGDPADARGEGRAHPGVVATIRGFCCHASDGNTGDLRAGAQRVRGCRPPFDITKAPQLTPGVSTEEDAATPSAAAPSIS